MYRNRFLRNDGKYITLHGLTFWKAVLFIITAERASDLKLKAILRLNFKSLFLYTGNPQEPISCSGWMH
jgi:hypothetical protein